METLYPELIMLELTTHCTLRCRICPLGSGRYTKDRGFLPTDTTIQAIDEAATFPSKPSIGLYALGDSLLHKDFFKIVRYVKKAGLYAFVSVNGISLTAKKTEQLLDSGIDEILFSFEGASKEYYESIRGRKYDLAKKNISRFLQRWKERKSNITVRILSVELDHDAPLTIHPHLQETFKGFEVDFHAYHGGDWAGVMPQELRPSTEGKSRMRKVCPKYETVLIKADRAFSNCSLDFESRHSMAMFPESSILKFFNSDERLRVKALQKAGEWEAIPLCKNCTAPFTLPSRERLLQNEDRKMLLKNNLRRSEHLNRKNSK